VGINLLGLCLDPYDSRKVRNYLPLKVVCSFPQASQEGCLWNWWVWSSSLYWKVTGSWVVWFSTNSSHWTYVLCLAPWWVFPADSQLLVMVHFWVPSRKENRCIPSYLWYKMFSNDTEGSNMHWVWYQIIDMARGAWVALSRIYICQHTRRNWPSVNLWHTMYLQQHIICSAYTVSIIWLSVGTWYISVLKLNEWF
jgi:hypothetical protein